MSTALERGLDALEFLAISGGARLAELAARLDVSRPTAFRLLSTLQSRGYVMHDRAAHLYRVADGLEALTVRPQVASLVPVAEAALGELSSWMGETACLAGVRGRRLVYIAVVPGRHSLGVRETVATEVPWHSTALGKAILAHLPAAEVAALVGAEPYHRFTEHTRTGAQELAADLAAVREQGYAVDDEETDIGARCFAAPIFAPDGSVDAALSVSCVKARVVGSELEEIGPHVRRMCDLISKDRAGPAARGVRGPALSHGLRR